MHRIVKTTLTSFLFLSFLFFYNLAVRGTSTSFCSAFNITAWLLVLLFRFSPTFFKYNTASYPVAIFDYVCIFVQFDILKSRIFFENLLHIISMLFLWLILRTDTKMIHLAVFLLVAIAGYIYFELLTHIEPIDQSTTTTIAIIYIIVRRAFFTINGSIPINPTIILAITTIYALASFESTVKEFSAIIAACTTAGPAFLAFVSYIAFILLAFNYDGIFYIDLCIFTFIATTASTIFIYLVEYDTFPIWMPTIYLNAHYMIFYMIFLFIHFVILGIIESKEIAKRAEEELLESEPTMQEAQSAAE